MMKFVKDNVVEKIRRKALKDGSSAECLNHGKDSILPEVSFSPSTQDTAKELIAKCAPECFKG